jgi:GNAT superfamily N-acetyltransferase
MRPQVIILSCFADDGENWAATFRDLLGGIELQSFQGAVVVCVADEGHIPKGLCTTRWVARDRWFQAEQVSVAVTMVEDICGKAADDTCLKSLQAQVSKLAEQCFKDAEEDSENDISAIAKQKGWTVAALVEKDSVECMASDHKLVGYVAYHEEAALGGLHLARVAVKPEYRKQGLASRIVSWTIDRSQKEGYEAVWSNAVPGLQNISTALGFAYVDPADEAKTGEDRCSAWMVLYNENQVNGTKECKGQCQASKGKTEKQRRRKLRR